MENTQKKVQAFIKETGITIKKKFLTKDLFFDGDKESRNIRKITIKRGGNEINFKYGDSIMNSNKKQLDYIDVFTGENHYKKITVKPSDYNILGCLAADYTDEMFEDRCDEFGYDTDSRNAEKIYNECIRQTLKIRKVFSRYEIQELLDIEF